MHFNVVSIIYNHHYPNNDNYDNAVQLFLELKLDASEIFGVRGYPAIVQNAEYS